MGRIRFKASLNNSKEVCFVHIRRITYRYEWCIAVKYLGSKKAPCRCSFAKIFVYVNSFSRMLNLPRKIKDKALYFCFKALKEKLTHGRSLTIIAAACIYLACRIYCFPRSLKEISVVSRLEKRSIAKCYRFLVEKFDLKIPPPKPEKYMLRIFRSLNIKPSN
ncbi:hypothetical protein DRO51_03365 [Candidatus Bathyarchaeota archaeon]|nr:MAG: hypothetical protein DRO51_03365 [Candidatus Bathyarchaeota archaeon]